MWDDFSEKIDSLREALSTTIDENDSSSTPHVEPESLYHFTESEDLSLDMFDLESLRKALDTPIDEIIAAEEAAEEAEAPSQNEDDGADMSTSDSMNVEQDEIESSNTTEVHAGSVEETEIGDEPEFEKIADPDNQLLTTEDSDIPYDKLESHDIEEETDANIAPDSGDITASDNLIQKPDESDKFDDIQESPDAIEDAVTTDELVSADIPDLDEQIQKPDEPDKLDDIQESPHIIEDAVTTDELVSTDIPDLDEQIQKPDEPDKLDDIQESPHVIEDAVTTDKPVSTDIPDLDEQIQKTDESDKLDDKQESRDIEIKVKTEHSIKSEKLDNYWKEGETVNPFLQKVDKSREELNKSLEMARELVNRQSEEPPKQEKKRFHLRFARSEKNENRKSDTDKEQRKHSKDSNQLKPMVYEMLEPKLVDNQDNHIEQDNKQKQEKGRKEKAKKVDDRAKSSDEREIINHRNRLEKSRSLGVPVFVKKPVNLEQIRQLKSMLISQSNLKILVDTGSSQGRLLVISGQDPDTLLNTLGQLSIVKSTTVEDETINLVMLT
jgi:hypothetical protein